MPQLQKPMGTSTLNFDSLAQNFLNYCAIERGLASNSVAAYRRDLRKFGNYLGNTDFATIDSAKSPILKALCDWKNYLRPALTGSIQLCVVSSNMCS